MKFQVTKLSALLGDPNEYIRLLGLSINSAGFTNKQLIVQMDTIQRKAETLKTSLEQLVVSEGNSGLTSTIKGFIDFLNQILKGLNSIDPTVTTALFNFSKLAVVIAAASTGISFAASAFRSFQVATQGATAAQAAFNIVSNANPWTALAKLAVVAGTALATYAFYAGSAANEQEKALQKQNQVISGKQAEIEMVKQQIDFMGTLGNSYVQLQENLKAVQGDQQKIEAVEKTMGVVYKELATIVGEAVAQRIVASEDIQGAITQEQKVQSEKAAQMETSLNELKSAQIKLMQDAVAASNDRIGAINNEASSVDKAAIAIADSLGKIDSAFYKYYKGKAEYMRDTADMLKGIKDDWDNLPMLSKIGLSQYQADMGAMGIFSPEQALAEAQQAEDDAAGYKEKALAAERERQRQVLGNLGGLYTPTGAYRTSPLTTGTVPPGDGGGKGGNNNNIERTDQQLSNDQRLWEAKNKLRLLNLQIAADNDRYKITQDRLSVSEAIYGNTIGNILAKETARNARIQEFSATWESANKLIAEHTEKINDLTDSNAGLNTEMESLIPQWKSLSKTEKWQAILDSDQLKADVKLLRELIRQIQELEQIKSKAHVDAEEIRNNIVKDARDKTGDPEYQFQRKQKSLADRINEDLAGVDKSKIGYFYDELAVKINGLRESNVLLNERLKEQQKNLSEINKEDKPKLYQDTSDAIDALNLQIIENNAKIKDSAYEAAKATKEYWSNSVADMVVEGKSFEDIMKSVWNNIAKEAINALFRVEQKSSMLGTLSGGKGKAKARPEGVSGPVMQNGSFTANSGKGKNTASAGKGKHAVGGRFATPHTGMVAEKGTEWIIPTENNTQDSRNMVMGAAMELGMFKGTDVVPYMKNPELAKETSVNVQVQQTEKHLEKLDKQNELMQIQNKMLFQMLMNGNNGGTVAQPIIMKQDMTDDEFMAKYNKAQAMGYRR
ncbi:hypothetical protein [Anaerospora hongkongensis]|uniref:hypothetical protein n=1 Tax=Anaerospora hongkongensis TaxID=244830 RepID=UPI002FD90983